MMERRKGFPSLETLVFCIVDTRLIMGAWWISWIDFPFSCRKIYIALNCETIRPPAPDNRWLGGWLYSWGESKGWGGGYSLTPLSGAGTPLVFRLWIVSDQNSNIESILSSSLLSHLGGAPAELMVIIVVMCRAWQRLGYCWHLVRVAEWGCWWRLAMICILDEPWLNNEINTRDWLMFVSLQHYWDTEIF